MFKKQQHPEDSVIDAIDELVNEQLAIGPVDDYSVNRYPRCQCGHDWHGVRCAGCLCPSSENPIQPEDLWADRPWALDPPPWVRRRRDIEFRVGTDPNFLVPPPEDHSGFERLGHIIDDDSPQFDEELDPFFRRTVHSAAPWVVYHEGLPEPRGYTMADLEAMRRRSWVLRDYPQRFVLGSGDYPQIYHRPRVRFWSYEPECNRHLMIEGSADVQRIDWCRDGASVRMDLEPVEEYVIVDEDPTVRPVNPVVPGMIAMEGLEGDDWVTVGMLNPDDLDIVRHTEPAVLLWGGEVLRAAQERTEARISIDNAYGIPEEAWNELAQQVLPPESDPGE